MVDKVSMSLDDIIQQQKPKGGGAGRKFTGRGRGGRPSRVAGGGIGGGGARPRRNSGNLRQQYDRASGGDIDGRWQHDMYDGPRRQSQSQNYASGGAAKLIVSNLDFGVSDADVTELFSEFGTLKKASIHYDRSGRSLGVADVTYERRGDAMKALKTYNDIPLDGRPMKIKFADEGAVSPGGGIRNSGRIQRPQSARPRGGGFRPSGAGRGGSGRGRGGGGRRKEVTAEELDAELDAWKKDV